MQDRRLLALLSRCRPRGLLWTLELTLFGPAEDIKWIR